MDNQGTVTIRGKTYSINEFLDITEEKEKKKEVITDLQQTIGTQKHIIKGNLKRRPGNRKINIKYDKKPGRVKMIDKESLEAKRTELSLRTDINKGKDDEKHIYYIVIDTMKKWGNIQKNIFNSRQLFQETIKPEDIHLTTRNVLQYLKHLYPDHERIQKLTSTTFSFIILYIWKAFKEYGFIDRRHLGKGKGYAYTLNPKIEKIPIYKLLQITKNKLNEKNTKKRNAKIEPEKKTVQQDILDWEKLVPPELDLNHNTDNKVIIKEEEDGESSILTLEKSQTTTISIEIKPDGTTTINIHVNKA